MAAMENISERQVVAGLRRPSEYHNSMLRRSNKSWNPDNGCRLRITLIQLLLKSGNHPIPHPDEFF